MRKILFPSIFILALLVSFSSCKKESTRRMPVAQPDETIVVRVAANQPYSMDLSNAGSVSIVKQASHFLVSQTVMNNVKGGSMYNYTPAKDFTGTDEVVFLSTKTSVNTSSITTGGCNVGNHNENTVYTISKHITVKIEVAN